MTKSYYEEEYDKATADMIARRDDLYKEHGRHFDIWTDVTWLKARLKQESAKLYFTHAKIDEYARAQRTLSHKNLARQYGIASDTIRRLRGEVALLRRGRQQEFHLENERLIAENVELRKEVQRWKEISRYHRDNK